MEVTEFHLVFRAPLVIKNLETALSNSDSQTKAILNFCSLKSALRFSTGIKINQNSELQEWLGSHGHSKEIDMAKNSQALNKQDVSMISRF